MQCMRSFMLWPFDQCNSKWSLTFTTKKVNGDYPFNVGNPKATYEIPPCYLSLRISFTMFSQFDLCNLTWALTFIKINRDHLLSKIKPHTTYEIIHTYHSWHILLTRFSHFDFWWHTIRFDRHHNQKGSSTLYG